LSEAIVRLVAEPDLREQLGRQGREYAVCQHSRRAAAKAFENIFKTLRGSPGK
jgi:glycosyltransferase involved in cell wall biosynthesis